MRNLLAATVMAIVALVAVGCEEGAPTAQSDNIEAGYDGRSSKVPVDSAFYTVKGEVVADVTSHERQASPAQGSFYGSSAYATGTFFGPEFTGKGLVRVKVVGLDPVNDKLVSPGNIAILKVADVKARALLPGDIVLFRCRAQYEAVAPIRDNERFQAGEAETWELDFCRLQRPKVDDPS